MGAVEVHPPHGSGVATVDESRVEKLVAAGWKPLEVKPATKPKSTAKK